MTVFDWMFLILLTLKLTGQLDWSWWWVTAPITIPLLVAAIVFGVFKVQDDYE